MNNCVEAAPFGPEQLAVRDSKDVSRPPLRFSRPSWTPASPHARTDARHSEQRPGRNSAGLAVSGLG
ncbi:DUF397 domain-containing protein [Streptomyces sp. NPDC079189]|uniref:DUF397 domain-containing protein n=1 Tax=Streptomyces sp. NPDC079189 TaxID=3154514 RepID=UPI00341B5DBD